MNSPSPSDRLPKQPVIDLPQDKSLEELLKEGGFSQEDFRDALEGLGHGAYVNAIFLGVTFKISNFPEDSNLRIAISVGLNALREGLNDTLNPPTGAYRLPGSFHEDLKRQSLEQLMGCSFETFSAEISPGHFPEFSLSILRAFWTQKLSQLREQAPNAYKIILQVLHDRGILILDDSISDVREDVTETLASPPSPSEKPGRLSGIDTHGDRSGLSVDALRKFMEEQDRKKGDA
ncbi:MAG: hypothetical protein AB7J40_01900 [Candidatus Altimarinota bacterium]